jgi:hypothetical protein
MCLAKAAACRYGDQLRLLRFHVPQVNLRHGVRVLHSQDNICFAGRKSEIPRIRRHSPHEQVDRHGYTIGVHAHRLRLSPDEIASVDQQPRRKGLKAYVSPVLAQRRNAWSLGMIRFADMRQRERAVYRVINEQIQRVHVGHSTDQIRMIAPECDPPSIRRNRRLLHRVLPKSLITAGHASPRSRNPVEQIEVVT